MDKWGSLVNAVCLDISLSHSDLDGGESVVNVLPCGLRMSRQHCTGVYIRTWTDGGGG